MASMKKTKIGQVVSDKMDKTVIVRVESHRNHPIYKKTIRKIVKYKVHDENNESAIGDKVMIVETRPLSKEKHWRVSEILIKAAKIEVKPREIEPKMVSEEPKVQTQTEAVDNKPVEAKQD